MKKMKKLLLNYTVSTTTVITNWKKKYPTLARFTAEEIGRALKHQGLQKQVGRVDGTPHSNCYELPIPKFEHTNEWLHDEEDNRGYLEDEADSEVNGEMEREFEERYRYILHDEHRW